MPGPGDYLRGAKSLAGKKVAGHAEFVQIDEPETESERAGREAFEAAERWRKARIARSSQTSGTARG